MTQSFATGTDKSVATWLQSTFNCIAPAKTKVVCTAYLTKSSIAVPYTQLWKHKDYGCLCEVKGMFEDHDSASLSLKIKNQTTGKTSEGESIGSNKFETDHAAGKV